MNQAVVYRTLRSVEKRAEVPVIALCLYEATSLMFRHRYAPPLSVLMHKHKWALPVFCGIVGVHVWFYDD
jgi:hypothetical protein